MMSDKVYWHVYDMTGNDWGDVVSDKPLNGTPYSEVLDTVFSQIPKLMGESFTVNDDDTDWIYTMWDVRSGIYDVYEHKDWTDNWTKCKEYQERVNQ